MLVASPAEVEAIVRQVPSGRVLTLGTLRALLATKWRADYTCPLTTAIFVRVMAEAACHQHEETRAPYWRVVRDDGRLLDRLPGGAREQARHLRSEGLAVVDRRNNLFVESIDRCSWTAARLADSRD
jgi:alkylated DNA nucleotide flippase Atl1